MSELSHGRALAWLAEQAPDAEALVFGERRCSRGELDRRTNRLARAYARLGVTAGDLVTVALPNGVEFLEACMAAWKLGATPNPVSARLPESERRAIVDLAKPGLLVGGEPGSYDDHTCVPAGFEPNEEDGDAPLPDVVSEYVRAMTSGGSTGRPKLIVERTRALCDPEKAESGMRAGGTTLTPGPLYHAGPFMTTWQQILCGGRTILMERFDAEAALAAIERERVSWVLFVPTMMQRIWRLPEAVRDRFDLSSLERIMCTGAPSPEWLKRAWIGWLGPERIWEAYGGSERIAGCMISGVEWLEHQGSVGKPPPSRRFEARRGDGSRCEPGEVGELWMLPESGQGSTYFYVGAEPKADESGWETVGDMGHFDADGYLYLADRKTDMIVTGGANVFPAEVEAALDAHPAVRSSAVIGMPDEDLGQRIHAIVDTADAVLSETEMREHLADRLVLYKIPRTFEWVGEPLRDDAGKVRRSALREARLA
ncbi:MAG: AMP-binding protein [Deltaproteobacteria bacterium]|nr:AMP-binding protein [Deltaproteobacteria bacterium]